jgi:hypothetical protein
MVFSVTWEGPCKALRTARSQDGPPRSTKVHRKQSQQRYATMPQNEKLHHFINTSSIFFNFIYLFIFSYFYLISIFSYITIFEVNSRQQSLRQQRAQQLVGQGGQQRQVPRRKTGESWEENEKNMENTNEIGINWH